MLKLKLILYKPKMKKDFKKNDLELTKKDWEFFKILCEHRRLLFRANPFGNNTKRKKRKYWEKIHKADQLITKMKNFEWKGDEE